MARYLPELLLAERSRAGRSPIVTEAKRARLAPLTLHRVYTVKLMKEPNAEEKIRDVVGHVGNHGMVTYRNKHYIVSLVILLSLFSVSNVLTLVEGRLLSVVPLSIQGLILVLIFAMHRWVVPVIRIWCVLLVAAGGLYWLSVLLQVFAFLVAPEGRTLAPSKLSVAGALSRSFLLAVGLLYLRFLGRAVRIETINLPRC